MLVVNIFFDSFNSIFFYGMVFSVGLGVNWCVFE